MNNHVAIERLEDAQLQEVNGGAPSLKPDDWLPFPVTPPVPAPVDDYCGTPPSGRPFGGL